MSLNQPKAVSRTRSLLITPAGVSDSTFRSILAGASAAYTVHRTVPTIDQISKFTTCRLGTISRVIATTEFKEIMSQRGYPFDRVKLAPEQIFAVSILTNPSNRKPMRDKLRQAGISYAQYRAWLKQPHFRDYISKVSEDMLGEHIQDVHTRVVERATSGDIQAIKLYYEITGRHDPQKQQMIDLNGIIGLMLEVITRYVPDTNALNQITQDIDLILSGGIPKALESFNVSRIAGADYYRDTDVEDADILEDSNSPVGHLEGNALEKLKSIANKHDLSNKPIFDFD